MIEKLIQFAMNNRLMTAAFTVALAILGAWCMLNIAVDSFPDVSNVQVQIITEPQSMAPEEVEKLITFPIEISMNGLPSITKVRSNSIFGFSVVTVIFEDSVDVYWARNLVAQRLSQVALPEWAPKPGLGPVISSFSNVYNYYLKSDYFDLTELRTIQDWVVARKLITVNGVGNVTSYGGYVKQYQVMASPQLLKGYGIKLSEVQQALALNNINAGGNFIEQGGEEVIIRGLGLIENVDDVKNIVLKEENGVPVTIAQVAKVQIGPAFRRGSSSINGEGEVVSGMVLTRKGVNTKEVVEKVRERIKEIQEELPEGVELVPYYDQTELVDKTLATVEEILLFCGGLVIVVLFAVLLHIPSALIVCVIIPLSLLFSFMLMKFTGLSANLMTLGAVDFGVIVDAGVVMVENIFRHMSHAGNLDKNPRKRLEVILKAAEEVGRPIVFAIAIIISVYLPLFTLEGVEGKMFHPLALTFVYALAGALLCSLTIIPVLCFWFMRGNIVEKHSPIVEYSSKFVMPALHFSLKKPGVPIAICLASFVGAACLMPFLGSEFIPSIDEGPILLRANLPPSVSHTEASRMFDVIEETVKSFPEVDVVISRIGRSGMGGDLAGVNHADITIQLKPKNEWKTTKDKQKLITLMSEKLEKIPGPLLSFSQPIADMIDDLIAGIRAELGIKIFGDNLAKCDEIAASIEAEINKVPGAADVQRELILGLPLLSVKLNRPEIARYGLNVNEVQSVIQTAMAGRIVSEVIEDTRRFGLLLRYPLQYRDTIEDIYEIPVDTPSGAVIPMKRLAKIYKERGTVQVNREDGQRRTAVMANVRGRDLGSFVQECQERVKKNVKIPKGYKVVWGGQFENQQRAMARLSLVVPVVLLIIFILLFASFNSLKNAGLIMLNVPFAMVGGVVALFISHQSLSVPAIIGFIALFGVAVQNGVIMVSYIMQLEQNGYPVVRAAVEGATIRLRPVLMTALVAIMGLLPKIFSTGTGAEVQRPLATVVLGGLVSATLLTLIVLPTIYTLINKDPEDKEFIEEKPYAEPS